MVLFHFTTSKGLILTLVAEAIQIPNIATQLGTSYNSVVNLVTRMGADNLALKSHPGSGAHSIRNTMSTWVFSQGVQLLGHEVDHPPPLTTNVKN